ncbi:adenosylcobinamide-GDP ribazoletransferase [uncultured Bacteroides sp.]|uniref:adenosylcobinamide-GDP ribazoletransferase n=1 Tax=uncultured Bacteroides sp. TaxID=162156 RepID=UPI002AA6DEA9|nr:adenosylcobinamide-GDP ribazoletransferase [uncultured Bacteroides sp.]
MTNRLLAAFVFFTRLPFGRIREIPAECFKHVVNYWPLAGWLTGGIMAGTLWLAAQILPLSVAVLLALMVRLLVTGCLHEDGLADFLDGFGGGTTRERTLAIMKDSHIGSYGVIGLVLYFALMWSLLSALPLTLACMAIVSGDAWSKFCAAQQINFLPYARKEEESKAKVVYNRMSLGAFVFAFVSGIVPAIVFLSPFMFWLAGLLPLLTAVFLILLMKKRLQGYTGDCCGAAFLLCELAFYLGINIVYQVSIN